jgi:hypothetical protein
LELLNLAPLATTDTNARLTIGTFPTLLFLGWYLFTGTSTVATRTTSTPLTLEKLVPLNKAQLATTAINLKEFWDTCILINLALPFLFTDTTTLAATTTSTPRMQEKLEPLNLGPLAITDTSMKAF